MASKAKGGRKTGQPTSIVIRREEIVEGGHHGGAWKVAYADFVTAMMAFFLLMWLINATSDKQRRGIADYFSPEGSHARSLSGSGKPFGGLSPTDKGSLVSSFGSLSVTDHPSPSDGSAGGDEDPDAVDAPPPSARGGQDKQGDQGGPATKGQAVVAAPTSDPDAVPIDGDGHQDGNAGRGTASADDGEAGDPAGVPLAGARPAATVRTPDGSVAPGAGSSPPDEAAVSRAAAAQDARFRQAADAVRAAVDGDPALAAVRGQVSASVTPEGLRIQIVDSEHAPMFDDGSPVPNSRARLLLARLAPVLAALPDPMSITGHTDGTVPRNGGGRSNWALSAARADATRMVLEAGGVSDRRIADVSGVADRDPLVSADPDAAENRRVVLVVHRSGAGR